VWWRVYPRFTWARFYQITPAGRRQLRAETRSWHDTIALIGRFFEVKAEDVP